MNPGLYVHIPFCRSKCYYCDFNSYPLNSKYSIDEYINALYKEIDIHVNPNKSYSLKSIYFGGGTPTILTGLAISHLLLYIKKRFKIDENAEITIEANPGTIQREKMQIMYQSGYNRISLGGQTFNDSLLKNIGRIHSSAEISASFKLAREIGFNNINLDIIYALPGQSKDELKNDLFRTVELNPEHISLYGLTIAEGTRFYDDRKKGLLKLPTEEIEAEMFAWAISYLESKKYEHYEISNFAQRGKRSVHNQIYWDNLPYIGIGAGAFSYLNGYRYGNLKDPLAYIQSLNKGVLPIEQGERLSREKMMSESVILWLRTRDGVNFNKFMQRFKVDFHNIFGTQVEEMRENGLLEEDECCCHLSRKGVFLANRVFEEFIIL